MRILTIITSKMTIDGITNSVMNYYRNMNKDNIKMDFVTTSCEVENYKKEIEKNDGKIFEVSNRKRKPITYIKKLKKIIQQGNYDIVHAHGSSAILCLEMIAAKWAKCKIRIAHSRNTKANHKIIDKLLRPIFYATYTNAFACGEEAGKWLFRDREFEIIKNGKNIEEFKFNEIVRKDMRNKYNLKGKQVIGHVGNFIEQKNHDFLIDVFHCLTKIDSKYFLVLIGEGRLKEQMQNKVEKLGIQDSVLFVGKSLEVNKWLQAMDLMVFPSKFEGFPNVLIEWQMAGLPCLISDKVTKEVKVTDLVNFASIEENPIQWSRKINQIQIKDRKLEQKNILEQLKENGFDIKENAKKLEELYILIAKNKNERN